jgi:hypothetical protein
MMLNPAWGSLKVQFQIQSGRIILHKWLEPDEMQKHRSNFSMSNICRLHVCHFSNNMGT